MHSTLESSRVSPETVSQGGAGALLFAVAVAELWLAFWDAGWVQRIAASGFALVGAALLARAVVVALQRRRRSEWAHSAAVELAPVETLPLVRTKWVQG